MGFSSIIDIRRGTPTCIVGAITYFPQDCLLYKMVFNCQNCGNDIVTYKFNMGI